MKVPAPMSHVPPMHKQTRAKVAAAGPRRARLVTLHREGAGTRSAPGAGGETTDHRQAV